MGSEAEKSIVLSQTVGSDKDGDRRFADLIYLWVADFRMRFGSSYRHLFVIMAHGWVPCSVTCSLETSLASESDSFRFD
jgi:hypothetical protein